MKILVVGAGNIGRGIYHFFADSGEQSLLTIIDNDSDRLFYLDGANAHVVEDFFQSPSKYLPEYDYVFMCVPVYDVQVVHNIVAACEAAGTHYIDFSEDVAVRRELNKMNPQKILVAPGCGLAPGMIQVITHDLTKRFDDVEKIEAHVGALPLHVANDLLYHVTWSVDGVVNEYTKPLDYIQNGKRKSNYMLDHNPVNVIINGKPYESFPTSGGFGTLVDEWDGKAKDVIYRTLRYSGHFWQVKSYLWQHYGDKGTEAERDKASLRRALAATTPLRRIEDRVVISATVVGTKDMERRCDTIALEVGSTRQVTAIQRTTAAGGCMVFKLHREGKLKGVGVLRHEEIECVDAVNTRAFHWGYK